jgi:hypothetical protein
MEHFVDRCSGPKVRVKDYHWNDTYFYRTPMNLFIPIECEGCQRGLIRGAH